MDATYAVYMSFWLRDQAVTREFKILEDAIDRDVNHPPPELVLERLPKCAHDIVEQLQGLDYAAHFAYEYMASHRGKRGLLVYAPALLCARVISVQDIQQK